ncbi:MAG: GYF domain-containing protein [Pirellulales bacterium]
MEWFVGQDGKALGPFSSEEVAQMVQAGKITSDTPIRHHQDPRWFTASQIPGLLPAQSLPAQPAPTPAPAPQAKPAQAAPAPKPNPSSKTSASKPQPELRVAKPLSTSPSSPVVAPPVAAPPVAAPPIMAQPVVAQAAPGPFQIRTEAAPAAQGASTPATPATPNYEEIKRKKKQQSQRNIMILGGASFAILVGAILIFALRPKPTETAAALPAETNPAPTPPASPTQEKDPVAPAETNPQPAVEATAPAAATNVSAKKASPAINPAIANIKLIKQWRDITKLRESRFNSVTVQVTKAWIAKDTSGTPLPPPKPVSKLAPPSETSSSTTDENSASESFIFVEIQLTNTKSEPVKITSWNQASKTPGVLLTQDLTPLEPIPSDQLPPGSKETELSLAPQVPQVQTLVFRGTKLNDESLRIALPYAALHAKSQGYFSYEIPAKVYMASPDEAMATSKKSSKPLTGLAAEQARLNAQIEAVADEQDAASPEKKPGKMPAEKMSAEEMEAEMPASEEMTEEDSEDSPDRIFPRKPADKKKEASDVKNAKEKTKKPELTKEQKLDAAFEKAAKSIAPDPDAPPPVPANTKTKSPRKAK